MTEQTDSTATNDNVLETMFDKMSDEEVLTELAKLIRNGRLELLTDLIDSDLTEDTMYLGEYMVIRVGDKMLMSTPILFDWPLQPIDKPEEMEGSIN